MRPEMASNMPAAVKIMLRAESLVSSSLVFANYFQVAFIK